MAKGYTLDTRRSLYGEPRLSDPQVQALRAIASRQSFDSASVATLRSLARSLLIDLDNGCITVRGQKILAAIDAAVKP